MRLMVGSRGAIPQGITPGLRRVPWQPQRVLGLNYGALGNRTPAEAIRPDTDRQTRMDLAIHADGLSPYRTFGRSTTPNGHPGSVGMPPFK